MERWPKWYHDARDEQGNQQVVDDWPKAGIPNEAAEEAAGAEPKCPEVMERRRSVAGGRARNRDPEIAKLAREIKKAPS